MIWNQPGRKKRNKLINFSRFFWKKKTSFLRFFIIGGKYIPSRISSKIVFFCFIIFASQVSENILCEFALFTQKRFMYVGVFRPHCKWSVLDHFKSLGFGGMFGFVRPDL
jgi:hypothetical protein